MSSRPKKRKQQQMQQMGTSTGAVKQNQGQFSAVARHEQRPAQLTPEIIAKFEPAHISQLVDSFCKSVDYQNETDRMGMNRHYDSQNSGQVKGMITVFGLFAMTLTGLLFSGNLNTWSILTAFIIAATASFSSSILQAFSNLIISARMKFKNPQKLQKN